MYTVTLDDESEPQVGALPPVALAPFAELRAALEVAPWNGDPFDRLKPDGAIRTWTFGPNSEGMAVYLVLESQQRVDLLKVLWAG